MADRLDIARICDLLRSELYENGYRYGFCLNGSVIVPDVSKGFDAEFGRLLTSQYRIQPPELTRKAKAATCLDAVLVMKEILSENGIGSRIWMVFDRERKKPHAVLTFTADQAVVYLELTPQSGKENYGKELVFENGDAFLRCWEQKNCLVREITDLCVPGRKPDFFLSGCGL